MQIWTTYYRGNYRPPIILKNQYGLPEYSREIHSHYLMFKEDSHCLRELLLAHEQKKIDAIVKLNKAIERDYSMH